MRRFLEIPSQSSVLICDEFYGMRHLGFKESLNYISIKKFKKNIPIEDYRINCQNQVIGYSNSIILQMLDQNN